MKVFRIDIRRICRVFVQLFQPNKNGFRYGCIKGQCFQRHLQFRLRQVLQVQFEQARQEKGVPDLPWLQAFHGKVVIRYWLLVIGGGSGPSVEIQGILYRVAQYLYRHLLFLNNYRPEIPHPNSQTLPSGTSLTLSLSHLSPLTLSPLNACDRNSGHTEFCAGDLQQRQSAYFQGSAGGEHIIY